MMGGEPRRGPEEQLHLPPGFRFYPSDEELVVHYLCRKAAAQPFAVTIIGEVDLYKFDPWDLPGKIRKSLPKQYELQNLLSGV